MYLSGNDIKMNAAQIKEAIVQKILYLHVVVSNLTRFL